MKIRVLAGALLLCVSLLMVVNTASAQGNQRTGTAGATELLIPVGARDMAMGGAGIATSEGLEAIYWNPAGLGRMSHSAEGMFSWMSYIADIKVNYGAVAGKFGEFGTIGFTLKSLDFGDVPLTTLDDPENLTGKFYSPSYTILGLTYGRQLTDAIGIGFTVKLINETIDRVSASGVAFDIGVQYHGLAGIQGLAVGVAVKNIGSQMKYEGPGLYTTALPVEGDRPQQPMMFNTAGFELPSLVEIGVSYGGTVKDNMMYQLNTTYSNNNLYLDEYRFGGEIGAMFSTVKLFARAGYSYIPQVAEAKDNIFGMNLGAGLQVATGGVDVTIDYCFRSVEYFDANNVVTVKLGF